MLFLPQALLLQAQTARVRTAQQSFNAAQNKLAETQQAWARAEQEFAAAESAYSTASNKLNQARQSAVQKHGADVGMSAALAERDAASRQITARRSAIEAELKKQPDFIAAQTETDQARERLGTIGQDKSLTDEQQEKLASELSAKIRRPTEMIKQAEKNDPQLRQAIERRQAATKRIAELQPQLRNAIEADPSVIKAAEEEKQRTVTLENARRALAKSEQDLGTAQANFDRQAQQLQAATPRARHVKYK